MKKGLIWIAKCVFQIVLIWIVVRLTIFLTLNYVGYCRDEMRFRSDADYIRSALARMAPEIEGLPERPSVLEMNAYIKNNPTCCYLETKDRGNWFERILGDTKYSVELIVKLKQPYSSEGLVHYRASVDVFACGGIGENGGSALTEEGYAKSLPRYGIDTDERKFFR